MVPGWSRQAGRVGLGGWSGFGVAEGIDVGVGVRLDSVVALGNTAIDVGSKVG